MKKLIIFLSVLVLAGCKGTPQDVVDNRVKKICIDGVSYLYMPSGYGPSISPHLKADGTPYTCVKDSTPENIQ